VAGDWLAVALKRWPDKLARLRGGFYRIKDKSGKEVPFEMNADQERFILERHGLDTILKARQKGFTTVIQLDMLDDCLFIPNTGAGVIAHNLTDAEAFFADKIRFAYDRLPAEFREIVSATSDTVRSLKFSNGSSIRVGTSLRSGTLQRLHVSEYGKLCAKFPEKAREVKTGAFNTVAPGQSITVESTAEGQAGDFYEMTKKAQDKQARGEPLTEMDYKFHFAAWFTSPEYTLDAEVVETAQMVEYFAKIEPFVIQALGRPLTKGQRAWYIKKAEEQGEDMKREYPSTPEEAFEASIEGAYFATEMRKMREQGRICRIPILNVPVDVFWDLGVGDAMTMAFKQRSGAEERIIDYYENSGEGFEHYARVLNEKKYIYGRHYFPHDGDQRSLGLVAKTKREWALEAAGDRLSMNDTSPDLLAFLKEEESNSRNEELVARAEVSLKSYNGELYGDEEDGRSQVVTRDVAEVIDQMEVSVLRVFVSGDRVVEFEPIHQEEVQAADDATEAITRQFSVKGYHLLHDWFKEGNLSTLGVVKTCVEKKRKRVEQTVPSLLLADPDLLEQVAGQGIKIIEADEPQMDEATGMEMQKVTALIEGEPEFRDYLIPLEEVRISKDHRDIDLSEAVYVAHATARTLSELVEMGFDNVDDLRGDMAPDQLSTTRDNGTTFWDVDRKGALAPGVAA
jgi:hypothetical protein